MPSIWNVGIKGGWKNPKNVTNGGLNKREGWLDNGHNVLERGLENSFVK